MATLAADAADGGTAMIALAAKGEAAAEARAVRVRDRIATAAGAVPGVAAALEGEAVVLSGRGLVRRTITDPRLHDIPGWAR